MGLSSQTSGSPQSSSGTFEMKEKQQKIYEMYLKKLQSKMFNHDHVKNIFNSVAESLREMTDTEIKNISRNRYKKDYMIISPMIALKESDSSSKGLLAASVQEMVHSKCKSQFNTFALCHFRRQLSKKAGNDVSGLSCQNSANEYISCLESFSNSFIMSSLSPY